MKKQLLSFALSAFMALGVYANEEAGQLWTKRGEAAENALKAANMVRDLAESVQDTAAKADLKTREAEYIYYVGGRETSKEAKKKQHERGYNAAQVAVNLLAKDGSGKTPRVADQKTELARGHYFYAINLGKWGEANGVLSSLGRWPELRDRLEIIESLDKTVEDFGANRVRARAYQKLPFGSKEDAEKLLAEATENTLADSYEISKNSTTAVYYLDILAKNKNASTFCAVYKTLKELSVLSDEALAQYNEARLPETKTDLKNFVENKEFEEDVKEYAKKQRCN